jgi:alkylhydroperoxidase/carboxymuconolactone decarboxylase family protein YurZ
MSFSPPLPPRDAIKPEEREAYDRVVHRQTKYDYPEFVKRFMHEDMLRIFPGDRMQPYFAALLNSPLVAAGMSDLGVVYRTRGEQPDGMSHADREWIDMVMAEELKCYWVLYVHATDAVAVGVRAEAILFLLQKREDKLTAEERLKADFIRAVARGTVTETLYKAVEPIVGGVRACVEFTAFSGHLIKTMRLGQAFGIPDISREQITEFVQAIVDGRVDIPQAKARVPVDGLAKITGQDPGRG